MEFDSSKISGLMNAPYDVHIVDSVDSTNNELKRLAAKDAPHGYLLIAREQTGGKGRLGRSFFSPQSGIYMSLLLRPEISPEKTLFLTTAAAVAVCRAIEKTTELKAQIKWVNDVYIGSKKVCGILVESSLSKGLCDWAVVGIGVNIAHPKDGFPDEIKNRATALFDGTAPENFGNIFAAALADELFKVYEKDSAQTHDEYRKRSLVIGKTVTVVDGSRSFPAEVLDVDDNARLVVSLENGEKKTISSGEITRIIL